MLLNSFKSAPWIWKLPFNGHFCLLTEEFDPSMLETTHDLFDFTNGSVNKGPMKYIVRFSSLLYPIAGALRSISNNIPLSMSQEVYMQESSKAGFDDDHDDDDQWLVESTFESNCVDFGQRVHQECTYPAREYAHTPTLSYNPYQKIMPKVKELVSLLAASNSCKERGMVVEPVLDKLIFEEKADLSSQKPPPRGGVVSSCPVGKLRKQKFLDGVVDHNFLPKWHGCIANDIIVSQTLHRKTNNACYYHFYVFLW